MAALKMKSSILLAKNILSETCKTGDQLLRECGAAVYTTARSVHFKKVFRLSQHIDRLYTSLSGLFPEEQKKFNITRASVKESVESNVIKARNYLCQVDPSIIENKLDVKFSIIIEKPTELDPLPMTVLISPMTPCHQPPIICDVYNVVRPNASVKHSSWVLQRDQYYKQSGKSVEEIILCDNDHIFEGGQSNFFAVKNGTVYTNDEGVLNGTVRSMVITLCEKLHIPLVMEAPLLSEVMQWDACFITSTSRFIMNINTLRMDDIVLKEFDGSSEVMKKLTEAVEGELQFQSEELF